MSNKLGKAIAIGLIVFGTAQLMPMIPSAIGFIRRSWELSQQPVNPDCQSQHRKPETICAGG